MSVVYLVTNKVDGSAYVGQTSQPVRLRWGQHCSMGSGTNTLIKQAIRSFGKQSFDVQVLETSECPMTISFLETYYIKKYNTLAPNGYNSLLSGNIYTSMTPEVRAKISKALKGRPLALSTRRKMAATRKKKLKPRRKGRVVSEETRKKISEANLGKKHSAATKAKMSFNRADIPWSKTRREKHEAKKQYASI